MKLAAALPIFLLCALDVEAQIPNSLLHTVPAPTAGSQSEGYLGYSAAVDGFFAVLGAPYDDTGASDAGVVKVFDSVTGSLLHVIPNPAPGYSDQFGYSVAVSGTRIVVGAVTDDAGATDTGTVYVYSMSSPTPTVPVLTLNNPVPGEDDWFGYSVAIDGSLVVVGAPDSTNRSNGAFVYDLNSSTPSVPVHTLNNPVVGAYNRFGWSVAISGTRVAVGAPMADTSAQYAGRVYGYDLMSGTPTTPILNLASPTPAGFEYFGSAVSLSGTRLVVGAWADNFSNGGAYVYDFSSGTPTVPVHTLTNPHPSGGDHLGISVSISGDTVVVGANAYDTTLADIGRAYLYDLGSATPATAKYILSNPSPAAGDEFGWAVSVSGTRLLIASVGDDTGASNAGSAYLYDLGSATPSTSTVTINQAGVSASSIFGRSVAVSGNLMVVGAPQYDTGAGDAGCAFVYNLVGATPAVPVLTLPNPTPGTSDFFGFSVAISGSRVVVGAYGDNTGNTDTGIAYVFDLSSGTPTVPAFTLNNPTPDAFDMFGYSVAISGSLLTVGAVFDDTGASNAGRAYIYDLSSGTPTVPVYSLNNPAAATNDQFGVSVAISGTRVVVGANLDDAGAADSGSAYVYDLSSGSPTVPVVTLTNPSPAANDQFGWSLGISGTQLVVGGVLDDGSATDSGRVYVYDLSSGTPSTPTLTLNNPSPATGDLFGYSVGISGTRVAVGARLDDANAMDAGSVHVYDVSGAAPTVPVATLGNPSPVTGDEFGRAVALDGVTLVAGAPLSDAVLPNHGAAYVFGPHPLDQDSDGLLDAWEIAQFGATTGHSALDDFDHDGYCELLELAFGTSATLSNGGTLPPLVIEGSYLTMTITKQPGVLYEVQSAGTLLAGQPDSFSAASTTIITNNATTLKVRDNFLISSNPNRFMRVKVTAAP